MSLPEFQGAPVEQRAAGGVTTRFPQVPCEHGLGRGLCVVVSDATVPLSGSCGVTHA